METEKNYLIIINDAQYSDERPYNALHVALNLVKREGEKVKAFLLADGVFAPVRGKRRPMAITTSSACSNPLPGAAKSPPEGNALMPEVSGRKL